MTRPVADWWTRGLGLELDAQGLEAGGEMALRLVRKALAGAALQALRSGVHLTGREWIELGELSRVAWLQAGKELAVERVERDRRATGPLAAERARAEVDGGLEHDLAVGRGAAIALAQAAAARGGVDQLVVADVLDQEG